MPDTGLTDRAVIVVGAAGALGAGLITAFTEAGAQVTGVDKALPAPGRRLDGAGYHAVDVLDDAALAGFFDEVPPPWAVLNTVGGFVGHAPLTELDPDVLTSQFALNLV